MKKIAFIVASAIIGCMGFLSSTGENIAAKFSNADLTISQTKGNDQTPSLILEKNWSDSNLIAAHSSHSSHWSHSSHRSHSSHSSHYSSR